MTTELSGAPDNAISNRKRGQTHAGLHMTVSKQASGQKLIRIIITNDSNENEQ